MNDKAISVSKFNTYIKQIFDAEELLFDIKVYGEISGFQIRMGTAYFTIKDENATLPCIVFDYDVNQPFKNGDAVVITGSPKFYIKGGKLNFYVRRLEFAGLGILYQQFIDLKNKLENKGYFLPELKKPIPNNIKRIGVVSSSEGAVIQDIINVVRRRNKSVDIVLYPVKVQGNDAQLEIAKGIRFFDNYNVDVIIVARGGGSMEDLQPFNTEIVADAIFETNKPIISAVGHETDFSICDFCADIRASTPSVAAELVSLDTVGLMQKLSIYNERLNNGIDKYINATVKYFNDAKSEIVFKYEKWLEVVIKDTLRKKDKFLFNCSYYLESTEHDLNLMNSKLIKLNPAEILKLGYACVKNINSIKNINVGDRINAVLKDGEFMAVVESVKEVK